MVPDAEILSILCESLTALDIGEYTVKINHRKILDGIFELAGVPADKTRSISSAVDKLDKVSFQSPKSPLRSFSSRQTPWAEVKKEMTVEKGLSEEVADKIGEYVGLKGELSSHLRTVRADAQDLDGICWPSWKPTPL